MNLGSMSMDQAGLPTWEIGANFVLWTGGVLYSLHEFYLAGNRVFSQYEDVYNDFEAGWTIIDRKKDISDLEWEIMQNFLGIATPWLFLHIVITEITKRLSNDALPVTHTALSSIFLLVYTNLYITALILLQPLVFQLSGRYKNVFLVWLCGGFNLLVITCYKLLNFNDYPYFEINDFQHVTSTLAIFWINLRCLGFQIDKIRGKHSGNFSELLGYTLYLPTLVSGPFVTYEDYHGSIQLQINLMSRTAKLFKDLLRLVFWAIFTKVLLHYVYVNAIAFQVEQVQSFKPWTMYGYGYAMGQFFHLKYIIIYGFGSAFSCFEGATMPGKPKCIGRIHLYSDMWKYFDEGLYKFLVRYIYVPSVTNNSPHSKMFSSFLCFVFIYIWHGIQDYILIWTVLNFAGVTVENIARAIYKNSLHKNKCISDIWKRRFTALCAAPLLAISAMNNFYFLGGRQIGDIFFSKFFTDSIKANVILIMFLYCCSQISMQVKIWEKIEGTSKKNHFT